MPRFTDHFSDFHLSAINFLARCFGVLSVIAGSTGVLGFFFMPDHPIIFLIVGGMSLAWGVAFIKVKRLERKDFR